MPAMFEIVSATAMEAFGAAIANSANSNITIYLRGELAAGKTTLARGFLRARGYAGAVKSPTFTLVETYELTGRWIHHFDLYRIADAEELEYIGFDEYFDSGADCLIEWPDQGSGALPPPDLDITLEVSGNARRAQIAAGTETGRKALKMISNSYINSSI